MDGPEPEPEPQPQPQPKPSFDESAPKTSDAVFDPERRAQAKRYAKIRLILTIVGFVLSIAVLLILLASGLSSSIRNAYRGYVQPYAIILYLFTLIVLLLPIEIPMAFYSGYMLEHRFGLSTITVRNWLVRELKEFALGLGFGLGLLELLYLVISLSPDYWWLIAAAGYGLISIVLAKLAPVLILPLFYKIRPLEDEELSDRLRKLTMNAGIKAVSVYVIDFSRETKKANAALTGTGRTRRILLTDTLLDRYSHAEIGSILAHELGHHRHHHIAKEITLNLALTFVGFWLVDRIAAFGIPLVNQWFVLDLYGLSDLAAFPVLVFAFVIFGMITMPFDNWLSRTFERQADRCELELTNDPDAFISSMIKLTDQNLSDEAPHPLIEAFLYTHPPPLKRIKMAQEYREGQGFE